MLKPAFQLLIVGASASALSGCNDDNGSLLNELSASRIRWESLNADNYQMTYQRGCNCLPDATAARTVLVKDSQVRSATIIDSGESLDTTTYSSLTVDELFARIALEESRAERVEATFHPQRGYPTSFYVDGSSQIADDEFSITVSELYLPEDVVCTTEVVPGLLITAEDSPDGAPAACGMTITATDSSYSETVTNDAVGCEDDSAVSMLEERPGFYSLTFSKPGFETVTIEDFGIGADLCHVIQREIKVTLTPQ